MHRSELERISNFGIYQRSNTIQNTNLYNNNNGYSDDKQYHHLQPQSQLQTQSQIHQPIQSSQRSRALNFNQSRSVSVNIDSNENKKLKEEANLSLNNKENLTASSINENSLVEKQGESKVLENYLILDRLNQKQQKRHESQLRKQQQINDLKQKHLEIEQRLLANNANNPETKRESKINENSEKNKIAIDNHQQQHLNLTKMTSHYQMNKSQINNSTNSSSLISKNSSSPSSSTTSQQKKQQQFNTTLQTSLNNEDTTKPKTSKLVSNSQKSIQVGSNIITQNQAAKDTLKVC